MEIGIPKINICLWNFQVLKIKLNIFSVMLSVLKLIFKHMSKRPLKKVSCKYNTLKLSPSRAEMQL